MESGFTPTPKSAVVPGETEAKTVADILTAAADLIEPEGRWTQGAAARNADGHDTAGGGGQPVCWCAIGAIHWVGEWREESYEAVSALEDVVGDWPADFNDAPERTQAEVVAALRAAADKARTAAETGAVGTGGEAEREPNTPPQPSPGESQNTGGAK